VSLGGLCQVMDRGYWSHLGGVAVTITDHRRMLRGDGRDTASAAGKQGRMGWAVGGKGEGGDSKLKMMERRKVTGGGRGYAHSTSAQSGVGRQKNIPLRVNLKKKLLI
jgi:hypothetical protein